MSVEELEPWCYDYIDKVAERYGHYNMKYVDVINEMVATAPEIKEGKKFHPSPFAEIDDFACKMFKHAKEKFPNSTLFYNDYGHESQISNKVKSDAVFDFVKGLKDGDCGIDAVGFQSHFNTEWATDSEFLDGIKQSVKRYSDLGLKVLFSEVDLKCVKGKWPWEGQVLKGLIGARPRLRKPARHLPEGRSLRSVSYLGLH